MGARARPAGLEADALLGGPYVDARLGDFDEARDKLERSKEICRDLGIAYGLAEAHMAGAELEMLAGDCDAAERELRDAIRVADAMGAARYVALYRTRLAHVLVAQGRDDGGGRRARAARQATTAARRSGIWRTRGCSPTAARPRRQPPSHARPSTSWQGNDDITAHAEILVDLAEVLPAHGDCRRHHGPRGSARPPRGEGEPRGRRPMPSVLGRSDGRRTGGNETVISSTPSRNSSALLHQQRGVGRRARGPRGTPWRRASRAALCGRSPCRRGSSRRGSGSATRGSARGGTGSSGSRCARSRCAADAVPAHQPERQRERGSELRRVVEDLSVARADVLDPERRPVEPHRVAAHRVQTDELVDRPVPVDDEVRADARELAELRSGVSDAKEEYGDVLDAV